MKTVLATLTLCLVALYATAFPFERKGGSSSAAPKEKRVQYAAWDDVNILAHGLLQLGQGLKEHVDKTKGQMRDLAGRLRALNGSVGELDRQGVALQARALGLEDREGRLLNVTAELRERADELWRERAAASERMRRLEVKVDGMMGAPGDAENSTDARGIQLILEGQNKRIDDLMERIRTQQDKLDKQNMRIKALQNQVQHTRERTGFKNSKAVAATTQTATVEQRDYPVEMASDCHELFLRGETASGVYVIQPPRSQPFSVFCEITADGGWTVIQRRLDGSVDFDQLWQPYQSGFGNLLGDFWLGLEKIHSVSKNGNYILQVKLGDWRHEMESVRLPFRLGGEETQYTLWTEGTGAVGNLESSLTTDSASGLPFSTRDHDNDKKSDGSCAQHLSGGWWFSSCGQSNLNGRYFQNQPPKQRHQRKQGIFWKAWRGRYYPLKATAMMIAPVEIEKKAR